MLWAFIKPSSYAVKWTQDENGNVKSLLTGGSFWRPNLFTSHRGDYDANNKQCNHSWFVHLYCVYEEIWKRNLLYLNEVAIPPAAVSIELNFPATNLSLFWRWKAFFISWFGGNVREGSDFPAGWMTWRWYVELRFGQLKTAKWIKVVCTVAGWTTHYPPDYPVNKWTNTYLPCSRVNNDSGAPGRRANSIGHIWKGWLHLHVSR